MKTKVYKDAILLASTNHLSAWKLNVFENFNNKDLMD